MVFTGELSPLAASISNSYTQNPLANTDGNQHSNASSWVLSGGTVLLVLVLILTDNWPTTLSFSGSSQTPAATKDVEQVASYSKSMTEGEWLAEKYQLDKKIKINKLR